jgi:hypothetical protein
MRAGFLAILLFVSWECSAEPAIEGNAHRGPAQQTVKTSPSAAPNKTLAEQGKGDRDRKPKDGCDWFSGWKPGDWIQAVLALLTFGYLVTTIRIFQEMRSANQATSDLTRKAIHAAHRPYLVVEKFKTLDESPAGDGLTLTGVALLRNAGTTGANNVIFSSKFLDVPRGEAFEVRSALNVHPNSGTRILSVGIQGPLSVACQTHMYPERQQRLAYGDIDLCFVGAVVCQDFFEQWHSYWFAYRRNGEGEWFPYRDHRETGPPTEWFDVHMAWAAAAKPPAKPPAG